ncbi:hypothetical protein B0A66_14425 [Flavobacterium hercynium]|uniref:Uncharacterized protein n=1 Tax=Flavobacterium hercynium TaxID=387094 RepID=A0A226H4Y3_9FLAO|nr:hypothetical protein B0A66_14425 [Flavobacterium hercynium]
MLFLRLITTKWIFSSKNRQFSIILRVKKNTKHADNKTFKPNKNYNKILRQQNSLYFIILDTFVAQIN